MNESIDRVSPGELIEILLPLYTSDVSVKEVPGIMLWGEPGIGKSESVKKLGERLREVTGKQVEIRDVRLLLYNPVDLKGIPIPDESKTRSIWLEPSVFHFDSSPNKLYILMLDEISAAPPSVQAAAYQLILDRRIGEHLLPDNVIIIAAGNRIQDGGVAFRMPTPLRNRMSHFLIRQDIHDWLKFAVKQGVHEYVQAFLRAHPDYLLDFDPKREATAFPTPRSWVFVSRYLKIYQSVEKATSIIRGTIGTAVADEFIEFTKVFDDLPDLDDILSGNVSSLEVNRIDIIYALATRIHSELILMNKTQIENLLNFLIDSKIPEEHVYMVLTDMWKVDSVRTVLPTLPRFMEFYTRNRKYFAEGN
jgi:MoxR-like ATPase